MEESGKMNFVCFLIRLVGSSLAVQGSAAVRLGPGEPEIGRGLQATTSSWVSLGTIPRALCGGPRLEAGTDPGVPGCVPMGLLLPHAWVALPCSVPTPWSLDLSSAVAACAVLSHPLRAPPASLSCHLLQLQCHIGW